MHARDLGGEGMSIAFDTLKYAKRAEKVGFTKEQAEFQAEELAKLIDERLATKDDLKKLESSIVIKMGSMLIVAIGVIVTLLQLFK